MTIAFIGFGEAGGILAADLAREHAVTIWDCKLNGPEREAMGKKARDSRVQVGNSLAQALEGATLVFSTVTAGEALKVAQLAAALLQPGQYAAEQTVTLVGPKGRLNNVRLLGPLRQTSQVEISRTDARILGIAAPLRMSGNLQGIYRISLLGQGGDDQQSTGGTHEAVLRKEVSVVFTSGTHAFDIILRLFVQLAILNYGSSLGHRIDQRADELRMSADTQGKGGCKGTDDLPDGDQAAGGRIL